MIADRFAAAVEAAAGQAPEPKAIPDVVPGRHLMVDGDYLAYFCGGNAEKETPAGISRMFAKERIEKMKVMSGAEKVTVHLTDPASTKGDRFVIATVWPYQGQRQAGRKPINWAYLRDWMQVGVPGLFTSKTWINREADDGATYHAQVLGPENSVLTIADKDWRMSPGWHLDWRSWDLTYLPPGTYRLVSPDGHVHGDAFFWYQLLAGDNADHIPGLPFAMISGKKVKFGPATAEKYINPTNNNYEAFKVVGSLYRTHYGDLWADALAEQMALLWMRRDKNAEVDDCLRHLGEEVEAALQPAFDRLADRINSTKAQEAAYG